MVFKQECRRYFSYQAQIAKLDEKIRSITLRMQNVHSPSMQKIGSSPSRRELDYIHLIEEKTACEEQKEFYVRRLNWIDNIINSIPSRAYCAITWMTLVQGKTRMELIITYDTAPEYVYKTRDQFLRKLLTDAKMKEFEKTEALRPGPEEENPYL